jgi:SNF2 family DNA or RNA helicase
MFDSFDVRRVLVIAPIRVAKFSWPDELEKWDHLKDLTFAVAVGTPKQRMEALESGADIVIINRENVQWLIEKSGYRWDFDMCVLDEASSFKNHQAKRFKSLLKVRPKIKGWWL